MSTTIAIDNKYKRNCIFQIQYLEGLQWKCYAQTSKWIEAKDKFFNIKLLRPSTKWRLATYKLLEVRKRV